MPTSATEVEGCVFDLGAARGSNFQAYLSMANIFCVSLALLVRAPCESLALFLWGSSYVCLPSTFVMSVRVASGELSINFSSLCENALGPEIETPFTLAIFIPALYTPQ